MRQIDIDSILANASLECFVGSQRIEVGRVGYLFVFERMRVKIGQRIGEFLLLLMMMMMSFFFVLGLVKMSVNVFVKRGHLSRFYKIRLNIIRTNRSLELGLKFSKNSNAKKGTFYISIAFFFLYEK